jgi:hypothetical protein
MPPGALLQELPLLIEGLPPDVREAIGDVDRSLIRMMLERTPRDRLRSASNMARTLARFHRETPSGRR